MNKAEILEFITANPTAFVATVEGNKPYVRPLGTYRADENGIIFSMQADKDVYKQVIKNPETQICYYADRVVIRISGQMEPVADLELKKEIAEARPFVKPGVEKHVKENRGNDREKTPRIGFTGYVCTEIKEPSE